MNLLDDVLETGDTKTEYNISRHPAEITKEEGCESRQTTHIPRNPININTQKRPHLIKINIPEPRSLHHLPIEPSPALLHQQQHLIVALPWEQNLPRIELVQRASDGPDVERGVVGDAKDDFGGAVEARDEVGCNVVFGGVGRGAKIAELEQGFRVVDLRRVVS